MSKDCLHNIIGLSTSDCPCIGERDDMYSNESLSGKYVDDFQYGIGLKISQSIQDCNEAGNAWKMMSLAREAAVDEFITHMQVALSDGYKNRFNNYNSYFGEFGKSGNANRTGLKQYAGVVFQARKRYDNLKININSIHLGINSMDDYDINIIRCTDGATVHTQTITVGSMMTGNANVDISLPLFEVSGNAIKYAFVYDTKGNKPKDYKYHCGCGSVPKPIWMDDRTLGAKGFSVSNISDVCSVSSSSLYTNGLIINFTLTCDLLDYLCDQDEAFWCDNKFGRVIASILVLMSNKIIAKKVVYGDRPDFYTLLSKEQLYGRISHYDKLINELMQWLVADGLPEDIKCCLLCDRRRSLGFKKQEILI